MSDPRAEQILTDFIAAELVGQRLEGELAAEDDLLGSGLVDSLGVMRLVRFLEERWSVRVGAADVTLENFMTVRAVTDYLERLRAAQRADG